jgi:hypothetical protein
MSGISRIVEDNNFLHPTEQLKITHPQIHDEFLRIQKEQFELFAKKSLDYGIGNITLGGNMDKEEDLNFSIMGIWLRCNDKINRLKNLILKSKKPYVEDESIEDSFKDMANYGVIAQILINGKWK